jgi:ABC-2 type transport system ATP-binding protein
VKEAALLGMEAVALIRGGRLLFERLDLALGAGEALLLTGPNGAGKSSLIRLAAGLLRPAAGSVTRGGAAALADEGLALDLRPTLGAALGFWARLDGGFDALPGAMEAMGLGRLSPVPVRMLSTGQRKRAALARVIASGAGIWLLDEPTNGLDPAGREAMLELIHRIGTEFGISIVVCSHLLGEVERICTGLIAIDGGRLLRSGSMAALTVDRDVLLVEVDEGTDQLAAALAARGLSVSFDGRVLLIPAIDGTGDETADLIVATVADLELPLHRLDRQRRRLSELFTTEPERTAVNV